MSLFQRKIRVLFVCTENICRSPMAEGLLQQQLLRSGLRNRVKVSSAGTRTSQPGCRPDKRAQRVSAAAGINLGRIRARRITGRELELSDHIIAMDHSNLQDLRKICPVEYQHKLSLLLSYLPVQNLDEVPDPYYGSVEGFEEVFHLIEKAVAGLIPHIVAAV